MTDTETMQARDELANALVLHSRMRGCLHAPEDGVLEVHLESGPLIRRKLEGGPFENYERMFKSVCAQARVFQRARAALRIKLRFWLTHEVSERTSIAVHVFEDTIEPLAKGESNG